MSLAGSTAATSGVRWLPHLPPRWQAARLATLFREVREPGNPDLPVLSVSIHDGISDRELGDDDRHRQVVHIEDRSAYQRVQPGDLVYNMMRAWQGAFGIAKVEGQVSPAYVVARPIADFSPPYFEYLVRCPACVEEMRLVSRGITDFRLRLYWEEFRQIRVALPPRADQDTIVAFLDRETARIDGLIARKRRLIELLREKRQAVISHAVTKGLDPTAPMKDSGIPWLGEIPAHWAICALSYRYEVALGKMLDEKRITGDHLGPYLRNADVQWGNINTVDLPLMDFKGEDFERYSLKVGDLLVCEGGDVGRAAVWEGQLDRCFYQKALHRLRPRGLNKDNPKFLYYALFAAATLGVFSGSEGKSTIAHLTAEALRRYYFSFPPIPEQCAIVEFLDRENSKIMDTMASCERAISVAEEHRAALVTAAVTGKIDVRDTAPEIVEAAE